MQRVHALLLLPIALLGSLASLFGHDRLLLLAGAAQKAREGKDENASNESHPPPGASGNTARRTKRWKNLRQGSPHPIVGERRRSLSRWGAELLCDASPSGTARHKPRETPDEAAIKLPQSENQLPLGRRLLRHASSVLGPRPAAPPLRPRGDSKRSRFLSPDSHPSLEKAPPRLAAPDRR